jgi:hypothetical protein
VTANQMQPHMGVPPADGSVNVNTNTAFGAITVRGTVNIQVTAKDTGVGLGGPPTITLVNGANPPVTLTSTESVPLPNVDKTFNYSWTVDALTANGLWVGTVNAVDMQGAAADPKTFSLVVNTYEINGVVNLDSFLGSTRTVTFKTGSASKDLNLYFVSSTFLPGTFTNRLALAQELQVPTQAVSSWLHFGDMYNLQAFVSQVLNSTPLSVYLQTLWFGNIADVSAMAARMNTPTRSID